VAFVWLPLPDPARYQWVVVAEEQRLVAMPDTHPLASRDVVDFADLLDEPFLALPRGAGPLRDYRLATDARGGRPILSKSAGRHLRVIGWSLLTVKAWILPTTPIRHGTS
jgi:DNA-binding transcriptional LysR family regulator